MKHRLATLNEQASRFAHTVRSDLVLTVDLLAPGDSVRLSARDGRIALTRPDAIRADLVVSGEPKALHRLLAGSATVTDLATLRTTVAGGPPFALPPGDAFAAMAVLDPPLLPGANLSVQTTVVGTFVGDLVYSVQYLDGRPARWRDGGMSGADVVVELPFDGYLRLASRQCSCLEAFWAPGGSIAGDLPELMLLGGLLETPGLRRLRRLEPRVLPVLRSFHEVLRAPFDDGLGR